MQKRIIYLLVILTSLLGCNVKEVELKRIENIKPITLTAEKIEVEITARIKNNNNYSFKAKDDDLQLLLNNKPIGKAEITKSIRIKGNCEESYTFVVKTKPDKGTLMGNLLGLLGGKGAPRISVKGTLKVSKLGISRKVPVDFTQNIR